MTDNALQDRVKSYILPLVPKGARNRIERSYRQWNQVIRDNIRAETGLKLSDGGENRIAIPVRVVDGFPSDLADLINQYDDPLMWRVVIGQPKLGGVVEGLQFLFQEWEEFEKWPALPEVARNGGPSLSRSLAIAESLQRLAFAEKVVEQIKKIRTDILGAYVIRSDVSWVELYWLPIAMFAAMLDVTIENLTVVVLIHELAHGYTHAGRDIDGKKWSDAGFCRSDLGVVEGLAQFYTEVISHRMAGRTPGLTMAYERLLSFQGGPYLAHLEWNHGDLRQFGETVRFSLIAARNQEVVSYEHWMELLARTSKNLLRKGQFED